MIDSSYLSSKYYDKYGMIFKDLENLAIKMDKEWDAYIKMYDEMDIIHLRYLSMLNLQSTDLKLYALMYRNVDIYHCSIVDESFFLSKLNEISGYRNTIYSNNASNKEKLVRYYFEYDFLFEMFFMKTIGEEIVTHRSTLETINNITLETIKKIKEKIYDNIPGIIDLSDQTCSVLLSNINQLESAQNDDKYFVYSIKRYDNFVDFIKGIAFPFYFGPHRVHEECFEKYSKEYCNNATFDIIQSKYYDHLSQLYSQISRGKIWWESAKSHRWDEIEKEFDELVNDLSNSWLEDSLNVWKHMYEHQECLQNQINTFYKTRYVYFKKNQDADTFIERWRSLRWTSVVDFLTRISRLQKEHSEKTVKRALGSSTQVNLRAARNWLEYIKKIVNEKEEKDRIIREEEERKRREAEEKRLEPYRFNVRNRHWRDNMVSFRETDHIYIVDGTPLDSVTTFVKNCFPEFDSEFHAKRKAEALGITKEAVLEMWDKKGRESREQGTAMHKKIESFYLGKKPSTDETFELFKIFADKITLKPYRTEWAVYDWEQKIAGTIDFVDYQNGEYTIYDWKRSDKLIAKNGLPIKNSQYGEKALAPIENLDDSPYYQYALQLSLYKYILEKNYGITVSKLRLGIFHPSYNKPYVLEMPYLQNEIETLFGLRSEVIF